MFSLVFTYITIVSSGLTAIRLVTYERNGRFKRSMSLLAWALICCTGAQSIYLFFYLTPIPFWHAGISVVIGIMAFKSRGNVSCFFRGEHEHV